MNKQRGAATVEAVVSFTFFLLVVFTLLNVLNYCRAQMIISNAVDAAAKELSQYSYFYKMSGLQKLNKNINDNTKVSHDNLNVVIDGFGSAYSAFGDALGDSKDIVYNVKDSVENGDIKGVVSDFSSIKDNASDLGGSLKKMYEAVEPVGDNPMLYIKSLAAAAGGKAFDVAKSRLIAAPLAKALTKSHLKHGDMDADEYLKSIGVVDGVAGLNFNDSRIFSMGEEDDIDIVCYYRLSLAQFLNLELKTPVFKKEAVVRAWLAGDDPKVSVADSPASTSTSTSGD